MNRLTTEWGRSIMSIIALLSPPCFFATYAEAGNFPTDNAGLQYMPPEPSRFMLTATDTSFKGTLISQFAENSDGMRDSLDGLYRFTWHPPKDIAATGSSAFSGLISRSIRETSVSYYWSDWQSAAEDHVPQFLSPVWNFFGGSLGNVREQELDPLSDRHLYTENDWLESTASDTHYGFRPTSLRPYFYTSTRLGDYAGQPIAVIDARWQLDPLKRSDQMSFESFEPLFNGWNLRESLVLNPLPIPYQGLAMSWSAGLSRILGNGTFSVTTNMDKRGHAGGNIQFAVVF